MALRTMQSTDSSVKQPQVVVQIGDRRQGCPSTRASNSLFDPQRWWQPIDQVDVGAVNFLQEFAGLR